MLHENIGLPHRKHLYQIMANELKIPHMVVSSVYMLVQALVIIGYLLFQNNDYQNNGYWYMGGAILLLSVIYILFMNKIKSLNS